MALDLIIGGLLVPVEIDGPGEYLTAAARKLNISGKDIKVVRILSKSLMSGDKQQFYYEISLVISVPTDYENKDNFPLYAEKPSARPKPAPAGLRPVIPRGLRGGTLHDISIVLSYRVIVQRPLIP